MKKILVSLGALAMVGAAFGQVQSQSLTTELTSSSFGFTYLNDGYGNDFSALSLKLYTLPYLNGRLTVQGIGAFDASGNKMYAGTGLGFVIAEDKGFKLQLIAGVKGLSLSDFSFQSGKGAYVIGVSVSIPLGK